MNHKTDTSRPSGLMARIRSLFPVDLEDLMPEDLPKDEEELRTFREVHSFYNRQREQECRDYLKYAGRSVCGGCLHRCPADNWCENHHGFVDKERWACTDFCPR